MSCKNFVNKQNVKNALELKWLPLLCSQRLDMLCCPQEIYLPFYSTHVSPHTSNPYKITRLSSQAGLQHSKGLFSCPKGEHLHDVCSLIFQIHKFLDNFAKGGVDYQLIDAKKRSRISLIVYQQQDIWWTVFEIILLL